MYTHTLEQNIAGAEMGISEPIDIYGVKVYINADPDYVSCDFKISEEDVEGLAIFREFAARMAAHYKTLKNKIMKYESAQQYISSLRDKGYLSTSERDVTCPATHEVHTGSMDDGKGSMVHTCDKCKTYSTITH